MNCQNCKTMTEEGYSVCATCELRFAGTLLRLARVCLFNRKWAV